MSEAIISKIYVRAHPNPKYTNIQLGTVLGRDVIVSKDIIDGQLGVYFDSESQLAEDFCIKNGLLRKHPVTGKEMGGYLEASRRVRALKLCEIKSEGLWLPLSSLHYYEFADTLKEGDRFQSLGGVEIVTKYFSKATRERRGNTPKTGSSKQFPKHYDTPKLKEIWPTIQAPFYYIVTEKIHGTSQRQSLQYIERTYSIPWEFKEEDGVVIPQTKTIKEWSHLLGTRNVIIGNVKVGQTFEVNEKYREYWAKKLQPLIHKNEVLYYEIVGYEETGKPIMGDQPTSRLKDKEFQEKYGEHMHYSYGNVGGNSQAYLYRVTFVNQDGLEVEAPWSYIKRRAVELGVPVVPILCEGVVSHCDMESVRDSVDLFVDGPSVLCSTHIREGICLRVENSYGIKVAKLKSFEFGVLEGYLKDDDDYVDTEEVN